MFLKYQKKVTVANTHETEQFSETINTQFIRSPPYFCTLLHCRSLEGSSSVLGAETTLYFLQLFWKDPIFPNKIFQFVIDV